MKRALLIVAGGQFSDEVVSALTSWWEGGQRGLLFLEAEDPCVRIVLVDFDAREVVADTERDGRAVAVLNLPSGALEVGDAADVAARLGSSPEDVEALVRAALAGGRP